MSRGRRCLVVLAVMILVYSIIRAVQGSDALWATAVAMVLLISSVVLTARRRRSETPAKR